jgi:hypothetical protein
MAACAAFYKESRMKFVDPTKPYRKSGGMGTRRVVALSAQEPIGFQIGGATRLLPFHRQRDSGP